MDLIVCVSILAAIILCPLFRDANATKYSFGPCASSHVASDSNAERQRQKENLLEVVKCMDWKFRRDAHMHANWIIHLQFGLFIFQPNAVHCTMCAHIVSLTDCSEVFWKHHVPNGFDVAYEDVAPATLRGIFPSTQHLLNCHCTVENLTVALFLNPFFYDRIREPITDIFVECGSTCCRTSSAIKSKTNERNRKWETMHMRWNGTR